MPDHEEEARKHFHALGRLRDEIRKELDPLQEERDALVARYEPMVAERNVRIKELNEQLMPIEQERAYIARGLNGKTGDPKDY
jgi:uncharacterized coiled-coil DUF342 family protein